MNTTKEEYELRLEKWLEALRSGKYKQGKLRLKNKNQYCCLGVASELSPFNFYDHGKCLSKQNMDYYGLKNLYGVFDKDYNSLVNLNDDGLSFEKIAEVIEKHKQELFHWA